MANYFYFYTRDFTRIYFTYGVKYETFSSNMYIFLVNFLTTDLHFHTRDFSSRYRYIYFELHI